MNKTILFAQLYTDIDCFTWSKRDQDHAPPARHRRETSYTATFGEDADYSINPPFLL